MEKEFAKGQKWFQKFALLVEKSRNSVQNDLSVINKNMRNLERSKTILFCVVSIFMFSVLENGTMAANEIFSEKQGEVLQVAKEGNLISQIQSNLFQNSQNGDKAEVVANVKENQNQTENSNQAANEIPNRNASQESTANPENIQSVSDAANAGQKDVPKTFSTENKNSNVADSQKSVPQKKTLAVTSGGIGRPGPIAAETDKIDGRKICAHGHDHPSKSDRNHKGHIDAECCLDPDETPNSNCYYPQKIYSGMIQKYLNSHK